MNPSEEILGALQCPDAHHGTRCTQVACHLHGITQLLHCDSYIVQAIGQIDPGGILDGGAQPLGPLRRTPVGRRHPRRVGPPAQPGTLRDRAGDGGIVFPRPGHRLLAELLEITVAKPSYHLRVQTPALLLDKRAQAIEAAARHVAAGAEHVEHVEDDVELPDRPQGARQPTHAPRELSAAHTVDDERQRLTEAPGRDPRLMNRVHIALLSARDSAGQRPQALQNQEL